MPIYEYRCSRCSIDFELMRRITEMNEPGVCPQCGSKAERLVSVFASKVGFYIRAPAKPAFRKRSRETISEIGGN